MTGFIWVWSHSEVAGSKAVCETEKLNECSLPGCEWPSETSRQVKFRTWSSACNSLTCLRKSLSRWPTTRGFRRLCWTQRSRSDAPCLLEHPKGTDADFSTAPDPDLEVWPGSSEMGRAMYHVITELPVYPRLGDRRDLRERWLGSGEVVNRLVMKELFLFPRPLEPRLCFSQNVLPNSGGWLDWPTQLIMNGLTIRNKYWSQEVTDAKRCSLCQFSIQI